MELVDPPTLVPYFSEGAGEGTDVSHFYHSSGEISEKGAWVGVVGTYQ